MTTKPKDGIDDINGIDLLADAAECVNTNVTGAITSAIEEFVSLEAEGEALSESAARVSKRVNELKLNVFPELLDAYGATSFTDAKTGKVIDLELLASIGAGSTIVCGITIGEYAMVGAGSVVTRDVEIYSLVVGNPARHRKYVTREGKVVDTLEAARG